jgi:PhzF family phenazine biosynthesis protein
MAPKYSTSKEWALHGVTNDGVLNSLGLTKNDLDTRVSPMLVNTGNSFIVIGVKSADVLKQVEPDYDAIADISKKLDLIGYYVFTTDTSATEHDATTRMFAPRYAIQEESATGMAGGPLACLLHDHLDIKKDKIIIDQGHFMEVPSPSIINVDLDKKDGIIMGLMAGGYGRSSNEVEIDLVTSSV